MRVDLEASDPAFEGSKALPAGVEELIAWIRERMAYGPERPWKLVSARGKLRKILFEVEEQGPDGPRRLIGKVSDSAKALGAFEILKLLWHSGFCPPSRHTVVRPVAWLAERYVLLQEKAPGVQILHSANEAAGARAAEWLTALQRSGITPPRTHVSGPDLDRTLRELPAALNGEGARVTRLVEAAIERSSEPASTLVPSHGDFHPLNVFLAPDGRVTAIDIETFAAREPLADVAYFLSQSAVMGYLANGSFTNTAPMRRAFIDAYSSAANLADSQRVAALAGTSFLQSLHFEHCILRTGNFTMVKPFLDVAERCLLHGDFVLES